MTTPPDAPSGYPPVSTALRVTIGAGRHSPAPSEALPDPSNLRLLIMRCPDSLMWYADMIGQLVPYEGQWRGEGYKSREPAGFINIVHFADAMIVNKDFFTGG